MTRSSSLLFSVLLAFNLALVAWWTIFQVHETHELESAGQLLAANDIAGAARVLGADSAADLQRVALARRRMFTSEGITFAVIALLGGLSVFAALRRDHRRRLEQDRFLAGATHELKTPLATIQLLLESLQGDRLPIEKRARYLQSGLLEAHRLERGLTNVLTAAGLRTTKHRAKARSNGDFKVDVERAIASIQPRAEAAGITIKASLTPVILIRDAEAMQLVLHNLLDNAIKFSQAGKSIDVQLLTDDRDAVLYIRDHGKGMDQETQRNAFLPFWRGTDPAIGGTGLGLPLVRELMRAQGGSATAHSEGADQGSEFTIRLPRKGAIA